MFFLLFFSDSGELEKGCCSFVVVGVQWCVAARSGGAALKFMFFLLIVWFWVVFGEGGGGGVAREYRIVFGPLLKIDLALM